MRDLRPIFIMAISTAIINAVAFTAFLLLVPVFTDELRHLSMMEWLALLRALNFVFAVPSLLLGAAAGGSMVIFTDEDVSLWQVRKAGLQGILGMFAAFYVPYTLLMLFGGEGAIWNIWLYATLSVWLYGASVTAVWFYAPRYVELRLSQRKRKNDELARRFVSG